MFENLGWLEIVFFYGFAISFALWQYFKMDRDLKQIRKEKAEKAAQAEKENASE
ncbi:hypothetical protein [Erythrobacter insulae]|uniref:hypothetical protein n=1 Tax=Erythrobacter insulae TaxID=2584124 RepID=UPI00163D589E|nr:hypothetical protein [Erythrobacter insulae]